ncbi:D-erythronate dehydrogenase [Lichenicoccus sp.]|uniref:D-erythronate dehydrogenase n=1 Tax=Lichenicoccus sp. TaxID=2781899 RepID=UPI003D0F75A2
MRVLILGAAGMIGRKLAERLAADGALAGQPLTHLALVDVVAPSPPPGFEAATCGAVDLAVPGTAGSLLRERPDVIYHLAAIVSGEAEADFERGYAVNLDGTRLLFEAVRAVNGWSPRLVFASSNAVFGGVMPDRIDDDFALTPQTSYGTQKAIGELLLADYSRRGFFDGIGLRLPTICVRPGKPNRAASSFFSGIIREPLAGQEAILPVAESVRHWMASPRSAVHFLIHAAGLDTAALEGRPNLTMPGLSVTVGEQIAALRAVAGDRAVSLIRSKPDPVIERIVGGWARGFTAERAQALGFAAESRFEDIIRAYVEDELDGKLP